MRLSKNQRMGLEWEEWVLSQLHQMGYKDAFLVSNYFAHVDIFLGPLPIEVKSAHEKRHRAKKNYWRSRWEFDTSRLPKGIDSLVVLVALVDKPYPFIVPSWMVGGRYNIHITSHPEAYRGFFKQFLNNWEWVSRTLAIRSKYAAQMPLPLMGTGDSVKSGLIGDSFHGHGAIREPLSPFPIGV